MNPEPTTQTLVRPANPAAFRAVIERVAEFLQTHEPRLRRETDREFNAERVTQSLVFHALHGTLAVVWNNPNLNLNLNPPPPPESKITSGRQVPTIAGVAIAWQTHAAQVQQRDAGHVFNWQPTDPAGDCLYLGLVVTAAPHAMPSLANYFLKRFPQWRGLNTFAHRKGQLRSIPGLLERLAKP